MPSDHFIGDNLAFVKEVNRIVKYNNIENWITFGIKQTILDIVRIYKIKT